MRPRRGASDGFLWVSIKVLQRSRGRETAERKRKLGRKPPMNRFNGAAVVRPRRDARAQLELCHIFSFNGAAVVRPRRAHYRIIAIEPCARLQRSRGRETAERHQRAAETGEAGKLQRSRGRETAERTMPHCALPVSRPRCFNGAAVVRPRRVDLMGLSQLRTWALQRSRGRETAERVTESTLTLACEKLQRSRGRETAERSRSRMVGCPTGASTEPRS